VAKLVAHLLATAVGMQTSLKNTTWATKAKDWPTHSSLPKKIYKGKKKQRLSENNRKNGISPKLILNVAGVRNYAGTRLLVSCACTTNW